MPGPVIPPLSDDEKVRVRHHMGYPNVNAGATFAIGVPATIEVSFIIELAMNQVKLEALPMFRLILGRLDSIEAQMDGDLELLAVHQVGEIEVNEDEMMKLDDRYERWLCKLEALLAVSRNPNDPMRKRVGGVNLAVAH
jgi:hypothetical protein